MHDFELHEFFYSPKNVHLKALLYLILFELPVLDAYGPKVFGQVRLQDKSGPETSKYGLNKYNSSPESCQAPMYLDKSSPEISPTQK